MSASDPSQVDAEELARNLSQASDEQLAELMSGEMRPLILDEIFNRMAEHFRPESARDVDAVIHWRIGGRSDGGADFLKLVTVNAAGPMLFMSGKLKIEGDLMFAASAASLFTIPKG